MAVAEKLDDLEIPLEAIEETRVVDVPLSPPLPCCKRIGNGWCLLPDAHDGDCHGVSSKEWPVPDHGPKASKAGRW